MCDVTEFRVPPPQDQAGRREPIKHVLYGSKAAISLTIATLHVKGYAETREWSRPLPTQNPNEYMSILMRLILLEPS